MAILNNDVELAPDYFAKLTAVAPDVAFATGKILSYHDRTRIDGAFDLVSRAFCPWRAGSGQIDGSPWDKARTIQLAPFTALLIRRPVFSRIGPLDARFESYLEDTDFGIRCALAGLAGMYVPQAVAFHRGSATLGAWSNRMVRLNSRNQVFLVAKHSPEPGSQAVVVGQLLWGLLALRHGTGSAWARGKWDAFRQYKAMRSQPHTGIAALLAESEGQIRELSRDTYWRWYFRLAGRAL